VDVARQITDLGVKPGEEFQMEMQWSGKRGDPKIYHAWQDEPAGSEPAESGLEAQPRASIVAAKAKKAAPESGLPQVQADSPWVARVRGETQLRLTLYAELVAWVKENLPGVTRNECRAILMNVMISAERTGRQ
jgi:hypothetical protein